MTVEEIKAAVDAGKKVYCGNRGYVVEKWADGYNIVFKANNHAIGLTWKDGVTLNAKEEDFFTDENQQQCKQ